MSTRRKKERKYIPKTQVEGIAIAKQKGKIKERATQESFFPIKKLYLEKVPDKEPAEKIMWMPGVEPETSFLNADYFIERVKHRVHPQK